MIDGVWLAARAAAYVLVLQSAGTCLFLALFAAHLPATDVGVVRAARRCAAAALVLCSAQLLLEPAHMAGEAAGLGDASLWQLELHSRATLVAGLRLAGITCVLLALRSGPPPLRAGGVAGVCLALGSFLASGHTITGAPRWALVPLLGWHVLAVSFWLGSLWPLRQLTRSLDARALAALLRRFSAIAVVVVPLLGLAGVAMACLLLPGIAALGSAYGLILCAKAVLFAALLALAALNRQRLTPALEQGRPGAVRLLRRTLTAEYLIIVLVLGLTAALTGWYSPAGH